MLYRYLKITELNKGRPCLFQKPSIIQISNYTELFGNNCIEYISEDESYLPERLIIKNGVVVIPTELELYVIDGENYTLKDGYYLKKNFQGDVIDILQKPTTNYVNPKWDDELEVWIESATDVEIVNKTVSDNSELLIEKERNLFFNIRKGTLKGDDVSTLETQKTDIAFEKSELQKQMQSSSDYTQGIITEEEYTSISEYVNLLIRDLPCERPMIMNNYDATN